MRASAYKLEGLKQRYDEGVVLDIPDLDIKKEQTHAIVGPNGAGKTTLLRILAFLEPPAEGDVIFFGDTTCFSGKTIRKPRGRTTFVMEDPYLFDTSVLGNMTYGLRLRGLTAGDAERRGRRALRRVDLETLASRRARNLSSGEGKRLAVARAAALDTDVILLDEPTSNTDRHSAEFIERLLVNLREGGTTIIFTTHDLSQAYRLADNITTLVDGRPHDAPHENIFRGDIVSKGKLKYMEVAPGVRVWFDTQAEGRGFIRVDPNNIILSRGRLESSARNCFKGRLTRTAFENNHVRICVDAGTEFTVIVTKASYEEMNLKPGEELYITFKTSSVSVM